MNGASQQLNPFPVLQYVSNASIGRQCVEYAFSHLHQMQKLSPVQQTQQAATFGVQFIAWPQFCAGRQWPRHTKRLIRHSGAYGDVISPGK